MNITTNVVIFITYKCDACVARGSIMIIIYGKPGCSACEMTKKVLIKNNIKFETKNVMDMVDEELALLIEAASAIGQAALPIIIKDEKICTLKECLA